MGRIADELVRVLGPLRPQQRRRALGELLRRVEDTLGPKSEATGEASRRAWWFGLASLAAGIGLYLLRGLAAPLATVGQLVAFAGIFVLLGPLSRALSDFLGSKGPRGKSGS